MPPITPTTEVHLHHLRDLPEAEAEDLLEAARAIARRAHHKLAATVRLQLTDDVPEYRRLVLEMNPAQVLRYPKAYSETFLKGLQGQASYGNDLAGQPTAVLLVQPDAEAPRVTLLHEAAHAFCGRRMGHNYSWRRLLTRLVASLLLAPGSLRRAADPDKRLARETAAFAEGLVLRYTAPQRGEGRAAYCARVRLEVVDLLRRLALDPGAAGPAPASGPGVVK